MKITLYKNNSENNVVNKELTNSISLNEHIREEDGLDILRPVILVDATVNSIIDKNYAYIEELNRYYFITALRIVRTGLVELTMSVDVLMNFKSEWLQCDALVDNAETFYNLYLNDPNIPVEQTTQTSRIVVEDTPFGGGCAVINYFNGNVWTEEEPEGGGT